MQDLKTSKKTGSCIINKTLLVAVLLFGFAVIFSGWGLIMY